MLSTSIFNVSLCYLQQNFLKSFGSHGSQVTVRGQQLMSVSDGFYLQKGLFILGKGLPNLFFLRGQPLKLFFPWGLPLEIYFFLGSASQNLFFSWRVSLKIYFFLEKDLRNFFFLNFLRPHPQIINGRPLRWIGLPWILKCQYPKNANFWLILGPSIASILKQYCIHWCPMGALGHCMKAGHIDLPYFLQ